MCKRKRNDGVKTKVFPSFCRLLRNRAVNELYKKKQKKKPKVVRDTSDLFEFDVTQRLTLAVTVKVKKRVTHKVSGPKKIYMIKWWEMMKLLMNRPESGSEIIIYLFNK